MSALERLIHLRDRLLNIDSGSGEAADLTKIIAVTEVAIEHQQSKRDKGAGEQGMCEIRLERSLYALMEEN